MDLKDKLVIGVNKLVRISSEPGTECPTARSGHRAIANESHMWVIGGYNPENKTSPLLREMWKLNLATGNWCMMPCGENMPTQLASHSALLDKGHMLVFGGTGYPFGDNSSNRLSICNLHTGIWKEFKCEGTTPDKKYGQAMLIHKKTLIVFGGTSGYLYNSDLHTLNLKLQKWDKIIPNNVWSEEVPSERYRHEIAIHNGNLFVLGGGTSSFVDTLKELHSFNFKTKRWTCCMTKPDKSQSPGYPVPRRCHGCVQLQEEAIISGGYDGINITGDVWKINLETMQWQKIADMPEPVYFHSAAVTPDGCMYIFGGVSSIEQNIRIGSCYRMWLKLPSLQTLCWQQLLTSYPQLTKLPHNMLIQLGVYRHLINTLPCPDGA